ncbi:zinc finger protein ZFMSA12A-like isoform X2 [Oryzias melastigma]|nr:zinc finger protein ZFMSA12A-like isoform X2 [Oryzias melastigma]
MFFCHSSGGDLGTFSKADILRGIITEKLSIATRDILAVVERTVADYEEEASGFRRRIARQERQLELLQPRVNLHRLRIEDSVRLDFPQNDEHDNDDGGGFDDEVNDEEEQDQPSAGSRTTSKDPDFEIPSRPLQCTARRSRAWTSCSPTHLNLRVRFIKDPNVGVLQRSNMTNTLVRDLNFPRDLPESEFVDLLRSSFPPLDGSHKAFEIYTLNRSKKLQKLPLKTMTPTEIIRSIKANAPRATVLFIKLKTPESEKTSEETLEEKLEGASTEIKEKSEEIKDNEEIEDSYISTVKDKPSSCDAEAEEEEEAGPSSRSGPHGFGEEAGFTDSPEHHHDDVDKDDASAEDPEWRLESKQKQVVKKAADKTPREWRKKRACKICGCWYNSLGGLIKHMWIHMDEPQRVCGVCGDAFESTEELKEHLRNYDKVYKCEECGKTFLKILLLKSHLAVHSKNANFRCDICGKKFGAERALNLHSWSHAEERPHKCDLCDKSFGLKSLLQAHRKNHNKWQCHLCNRSLSSSRALAWHLMSHSEKRHFACEVCGKRFKILHTLNIHKKVHMNRERSFLCHICCKTFYCNGSLKTHMKTHSSERPFVCQDCGKGFVSKGNLKIHQRVHTGETPYGCSHCGRRFKLQSALKSHVRIHLGIKLFTCPVCGKAIARQEHLKVHMRIHSGERPYKCLLCVKAFTQSHCLKTHMMKHHAGENQNQDQTRP